MTDHPETVVHVAGRRPNGEPFQTCLDCGYVLWVRGNEAQPAAPSWDRGDLVAVRVDETPRDGYIVGYWKVDPKQQRGEDERRCTERL